jgi:hypothetical protein
MAKDMASFTFIGFAHFEICPFFEVTLLSRYSYGFFRKFRTAKNTTCNEVQRTVAAPESCNKRSALAD